MRYTLQDKVAALCDPASHPLPVSAVESIETHFSWVFLAGERAYKMKKPQPSGLPDLSTLERRRQHCREELRLNRRLAPKVYLDVVPLAADANGQLRVDGPGRPVEWLVAMRRLSPGPMLDQRLLRGEATEADMRRIAWQLAGFHRWQPCLRLDPAGHRLRLWQRVADCEAVLWRPEWRLPLRGVALLMAALRAWLASHAPLIDARALAGCVIEAHGDLRPEHVWLGDTLAIIDALSFSREWRQQDGADEAGFLALECERAGAPALGEALLRHYAEASGQAPPRELVHFYQALRACERAGHAIAHLGEARHQGDPRWRRRARQYLALAACHLRAARTPLGRRHPAQGAPTPPG
jgi:aminoglycoside phosphotransferase family enzyme